MDAIIQYQDISGNWISCEVVPDQPPLILQSMQRAANLYRDRRIRAIDSEGKLLDNL